MALSPAGDSYGLIDVQRLNIRTLSTPWAVKNVGAEARNTSFFLILFA
jgi:hypothetical protein